MNFREKLSNGDFVTLAEMSSPKGVDIFDLVANLRHLKSRIDTIIMPDMDSGVMHLGALAAGSVIRQQGLEPMIHVHGRDRNRISLQGDMLAAHVLGIHNLLVVKGETMANGDHPDAAEVDDLDEKTILVMIDSLLKGSDLAGFELKGAPDFFAGCQVPPVKDEAHLKELVASAKEKVEAGAKFVVLSPVFDTEFCKTIVGAFSALEVPVIATVSMLKSVGMARYISINDPDARLSESVISRIRKAKDREAECIAIAGEMIQAVKNDVQGIKISALGWEDRLPAILDSAGL